MVIEDFGTLGMNVDRWRQYQSLWDTTKSEEATLGARGQGKFLFHYFSKDKLVITETVDEAGNYRFSFGNNIEYDDETKKLQEFVPNESPLYHQGTRIWIMNLKEDLKEELIDHKALMGYVDFSDYIAATWWEIIRNWDATFIVNFDGNDVKVGLPQLPTIDKEKVFLNEKIGSLGKVKKLVLRYYRDEIPELLRGVAIQRGGMTITRVPISAEETIKNKLCGYCTFDENLELELKRVEYPNHFGFMGKKAWNHTKEYIRRKADSFVQEISPTKKRKEMKLPQDLIDRAVQIVNDLVREYAPELASEVAGDRGKKKDGNGHRPPKPPPPIRIDSFRGNSRKLEYDESLITECELINDTKSESEAQLRLEIRHEAGDLKFDLKYTIRIDENARKPIDIPLVDFQEGIDKPGEYLAIATLNDTSGVELHRRSFTFYLHEDPPPPRGRVFLSSMAFSYGKGTPLERKKHLPVTEKGLLRIVYDHPDFVHVREMAGSRKAARHEIFVYAVKCGVDEAIQKLLEFRYNEGELDIDTIREIKAKCDEMYYDAVLSTVA